MPNLHVSYNPAMTALLVARGVFHADPLVVADVGARGGVEGYWQVFGNDIRIVGFELDPTECERLNAQGDPRVRYLPHALGRANERRKLYVARHSPSTGLYQPNHTYFARYLETASLATVSEVMIETTTLPEALGDIVPDFIKLDVEGAELEVLQGAASIMPEVLGFVTEVRFSRSICNSPIFWETERYAREQGFELYDLDVYRFAKRALPYPFLYSNHGPGGEPTAGPSIQGQAMWGDALYFRDFVNATPRKLLAMACLFEIFGLNDCAAELILSHRQVFEVFAPVDSLLDLLVPEVKGRQMSYREYVARDPLANPLLRPAEGKRYPEAIISHYDGQFTPSWKK